MGRHDQRRPEAERLIANIFRVSYGANVTDFPQMVVARMDEHGHCICAAGLRLASDGFFSERYLDRPVEEMIGMISGKYVDRSRIFEVSSLASRRPSHTASFIFDIIRHGQDNGFEWSFFTLTRRFSLMLTRIGIAPHFLGGADRRRVPHYRSWGSYYDQHPSVFALPNPQKSYPFAIPPKESSHAFSL
uniref:Thermostable hemolysin n=1 Tax=Rhizobium leguminosarum TaxID=384 RepID=A0A179C1P1_RHILE|nr:thermostable hemolysin [Rhizobium leguminosarum]OAP97545.1 hypothetical protein A4U53_36675 [Rhizobium leguminosarum]